METAGVVDLPAARPLPPTPGWDNPLQRLDEIMDQTAEWAQLRSILERKPAWVRNTICCALHNEFQRSLHNVVGQLQDLKAIKECMEQLLESDDARALGHLMQDIHPSNGLWRGSLMA